MGSKGFAGILGQNSDTGKARVVFVSFGEPVLVSVFAITRPLEERIVKGIMLRQHDLDTFIGQTGHHADMIFVPMEMIQDQINLQPRNRIAQTLSSKRHLVQRHAG